MAFYSKYIAKFKKKVFFVLGVFEKDGAKQYRALLISILDNEYKIKERFSFEDLSFLSNKKLKKDIPILLYVDGEATMTKVLPKTTNYKSKILFNAVESDFFFYEYHTEEKVYTTVIRKQDIQSQIDILKQFNHFVIDLSIGPFAIANSLPLLESGMFHIGYHEVEIQNNSISSYKKIDEFGDNSYDLEGEKLTGYELPLFATLLGHLHPSKSLLKDSIDIEENKQELKYSKLLRHTVISGLALVLSSIVIGQILLSNFSTALAENSVRNITSQQTINEVTRLTSEVELKRSILETSGINSNTFLVRYLSEIGNSVPQEITLESVQLRPTLKKVKADDKIEFDLVHIIITGKTSKDDVFSNWVKSLESFNSLKRVAIAQYSKSNYDEKSFELRIEI